LRKAAQLFQRVQPCNEGEIGLLLETAQSPEEDAAAPFIYRQGLTGALLTRTS
jgi:hypothetical protein